MISRRSFLAYLSAAVPVVAIAPQLLVEPKRTILLPPRGGWKINDIPDGYPRRLQNHESFSGWYHDPDALYQISMQPGDEIVWNPDAFGKHIMIMDRNFNVVEPSMRRLTDEALVGRFRGTWDTGNGVIDTVIVRPT